MLWVAPQQTQHTGKNNLHFLQKETEAKRLNALFTQLAGVGVGGAAQSLYPPEPKA